MIDFILNNEDISTFQPSGSTVLDFVRYHKNLKGTKIGCREGDCGACTILVGELVGDRVKYRSMTSCLMPLANAAGRHIVTVEGINPEDGSLTPVQKAMVDESGTQCGFCTVGFVMSLTGFCMDRDSRVSEPSVGSPHVSGVPTAASASGVVVSKGHIEQTQRQQAAISSVDGNICRCTGYKSIERAAIQLSEPPASAGGQFGEISDRCVPEYFAAIADRLKAMRTKALEALSLGRVRNVAVVGGGTDTYVQKPEWMADNESTPLLYDEHLRGIRDLGDTIEIGGSATVTDLLESPVMQAIFPDLYKHLKLISSTPIRNMATLAGNFVNASPIGDMTVWFLALDAEICLSVPPAVAGGLSRQMKLQDLYLGYKQLAKSEDEMITAI
ncbi:MAG TPA: FAD binding domain-containing protein, partial [Pyrinomonadaceae bacterium]